MDLLTYLDLSSRYAMAVSLREMLYKASLSSYSNFGDRSLFKLLIEHLDIVVHNEES